MNEVKTGTQSKQKNVTRSGQAVFVNGKLSRCTRGHAPLSSHAPQRPTSSVAFKTGQCNSAGRESENKNGTSSPTGSSDAKAIVLSDSRAQRADKRKHERVRPVVQATEAASRE